MRKWTRWQDWVTLVAGVFAALSPLWFDTDNAAAWTMVVLGALIALTSLWSLAMPGMMSVEISHAVLGILLFLAPWVITYTEFGAASWTSWIVGVVAVVAGLWALPQVRGLANRNLAHR